MEFDVVQCVWDFVFFIRKIELRGRFSCLLALSNTLLLPVGVSEHHVPALWHWRGRCSCHLAMTSTLLLPSGAGEHDVPALWRWRARFSCALALASTLLLPFGVGEHASPAIWCWRARFSCALARTSTRRRRATACLLKGRTSSFPKSSYGRFKLLLIILVYMMDIRSPTKR